MSLGQIIRNKREQLRLTLDEVAATTGFSKPYLSTIETGKVKNPPSDALLRKLERVLKFDPSVLQHIAHVERMPSDVRRDYEAIDAQNRRYRKIIKHIIDNGADTIDIGNILDDDELNIDAPQRKLTAGELVPIINNGSACYPADFDEFGRPLAFSNDYVRCPDLHDPNAFAVKVIDDSMEPKFTAGDIVIFSPASDVHSGDDCFVRFTMPHETTFKRVYFATDNTVRLQPRNEKYPPETIDGDRINRLYCAVVRYERL